MQSIKSWVKRIGRRYWAPAALQHPGLAPAHWGLAYESGALSYSGVVLADLLKRWGSPLHVVFPEKLLRNLAGFQSSGLEVFYSYKTNPLPWIFSLLHKNGAGAEVISAYELWLALKLGVAPDKIIYNGPAKTDDSLRMAIESGIASINVNNMEELEVIAAMASRMGKVANIGVRVTSSQGWTGQFGFPVESGAAKEAYRRALELPSLNVVALHCHRGALISNVDTLTGHLRFMLEFAQTLHSAFGWWPKLLDVGGSLATPSTRYLGSREIKLATTFLVPPKAPDLNDSLLPDTYAQVVVETVGKFCTAHGQAVPRLVCEVGRSLTGNAQMLLSSVLNTRAGDDFDYAVMDAGVSVASIVTNEYHEFFPLQQRSEPKRCHRVVGPICHMGDTLYMVQYQPPLHKGDGVAIMDSGAYFIADAASFSFAQPAVVALHSDGHQTLIRHAETNEHLISLDEYETLAPNPQ